MLLMASSGAMPVRVVITTSTYKTGGQEDVSIPRWAHCRHEKSEAELMAVRCWCALIACRVFQNPWPSLLFFIDVVHFRQLTCVFQPMGLIFKGLFDPRCSDRCGHGGGLVAFVGQAQAGFCRGVALGNLLFY